jgi:hypothetical protein
VERPGKEEEGAMMNTSGNGGDVGKCVEAFVEALPFLAPSILSKWLIARVKCLRRGSNSHLYSPPFGSSSNRVNCTS